MPDGLDRSQLPTELWKDSQTSGYDLFARAEMGGLTLSYYRVADGTDGFRHVVGNPDLPPGAVFRSAPEVEQAVNIAGARFDDRTEDGTWSLSATGTYANRDGHHCAACHGPAQSDSFLEPEDHGFQAYGIAQVGYHALDDHELLIGVEGRSIGAGKHSHELDGATQIGEDHEDAVLDYRKYALFVQDHARFLNDRLHIVAGLRFDFETDPYLFGNETSPRLDVMYKLDDATTLRAQWARATRYPSFSELYQDNWFLAAESDFTDPIPLGEFEANPDLGPESVESVGVGVERRFGAGLRLGVAYYVNEIESPIALAYPAFSYENHPQGAIVDGLELDVRWERSRHLHGYVNYSYQHNARRGAGVDSTGAELGFHYSPKHKAKAGVVFSPTSDLTVSADMAWQSEYGAPAFWYPIALQSEPAPLRGFAYVNARLDYRVPWKVGSSRPLQISAIAKNLLDETPYETLTGFGGRNVGREAYLQLEYRWSD